MVKWLKARFRRRSTHVPNLTDEISPAKEVRLNQFGTAVLIRCDRNAKLKQSLSHYSTLDRQVIHTGLFSSAEPNAYIKFIIFPSIPLVLRSCHARNTKLRKMACGEEQSCSSRFKNTKYTVPEILLYAFSDNWKAGSSAIYCEPCFREVVNGRARKGRM